MRLVVIFQLLLTIGLAGQSTGTVAVAELEHAPQEKVAAEEKVAAGDEIESLNIKLASVDGIPQPSEISRDRRRADESTIIRWAGM